MKFVNFAVVCIFVNTEFLTLWCKHEALTVITIKIHKITYPNLLPYKRTLMNLMLMQNFYH
jgi:hypothetical protein